MCVPETIPDLLPGPVGGWLAEHLRPVFTERGGECVCVLGILISSHCPPAQLPPSCLQAPPRSRAGGRRGFVDKRSWLVSGLLGGGTHLQPSDL